MPEHLLDPFRVVVLTDDEPCVKVPERVEPIFCRHDRFAVPVEHWLAILTHLRLEQRRIKLALRGIETAVRYVGMTLDGADAGREYEIDQPIGGPRAYQTPAPQNVGEIFRQNDGARAGF